MIRQRSKKKEKRLQTHKSLIVVNSTEKKNQHQAKSQLLNGMKNVVGKGNTTNTYVVSWQTIGKQYWKNWSVQNDNNRYKTARWREKTTKIVPNEKQVQMKAFTDR